ncbi:hypothetical protein PS723_04655 [Pseudomonas fluorescens]|uniref:Uncharacterized protein n=1 Tax=Pseudomonas fluorescens TaxID=294 RepID=A0A5E7EII3_PSEFL|nr:hypothetical protein PS723_04655 [Pseudomonas fluorescens]
MGFEFWGRYDYRIMRSLRPYAVINTQWRLGAQLAAAGKIRSFRLSTVPRSSLRPAA